MSLLNFEGLSERIRAAIDAVDERPSHTKSIAAAHGALTMMGTVGTLWALRPSGELVEIEGTDGEGRVTPLPEVDEVAAIVYGAVEHPWLAHALPAPAERSRVCAYCRGDRFLGSERHPHVCPLCSGLGFLDLAKGTRVPTRMEHGFLDGFITDFNEQGMEASYHLVFIPNDAPRDRGAMRIVQSGDELWLWERDGSVLWTGFLHPKKRLLRSSIGPQHYAWSAPGISQETWLDWFRRRPCLLAWWR